MSKRSISVIGGETRGQVMHTLGQVTVGQSGTGGQSHSSSERACLNRKIEMLSLDVDMWIG